MILMLQVKQKSKQKGMKMSETEMKSMTEQNRPEYDLQQKDEDFIWHI